MDEENTTISQIIGRGGLLQNSKDEEPGFNLPGCCFNSLTRSMSIHSRQKRKRWGCNPRSDCQKMTSIHAAAFSEYSVKPTTHQALSPSAPIWLYCKAIFVMDLLICSASVKAWRQRHIKVGVLREGSMVKTKWHFTETCQSLWFKTWQTIQKSTVGYSLYIFDNSPR